MNYAPRDSIAGRLFVNDCAVDIEAYRDIPIGEPAVSLRQISADKIDDDWISTTLVIKKV